jgi:hypothetical protein
MHSYFKKKLTPLDLIILEVILGFYLNFSFFEFKFEFLNRTGFIGYRSFPAGS